jgi:SAM-dependent MidA family methyltransferase
MNIRRKEGQSAEVNLGISDWLTKAAATLARGYLITVDYGAEAAELFSATDRPHGTLRSFKRHEFVADVLANPGEQDITSSVDWSAVIRTGEALGFRKVIHERQDRFLMNEGLLEELELRVGETADEAERARLRASCRELILPDGMAASFQVLVQEKL